MTFNIASFLSACPGAVSQGIIWGIMALGVFITFKVLDYADLTVDSSLCTGGAVSAVLILNGMSPLLSLVFATLSGMLAGAITGLLHTKLAIPPILSGILTQLALYSINMRIMGRANIPLLGQNVLVSLRNIPTAIIISTIFVIATVLIMYWFFGTEIGCSIRATGDNENMSRALGANTNITKMIGLIISNGLVGLSGALLAQYQGYADINMGRGAIVIGLAAVIIGEVILGKHINFAFRMIGAIIGAIVYYIVITFVLQAGLNTNDLKMFSAIVVTLALSMPLIKARLTKPSHRKSAKLVKIS